VIEEAGQGARCLGVIVSDIFGPQRRIYASQIAVGMGVVLSIYGVIFTVLTATFPWASVRFLSAIGGLADFPRKLLVTALTVELEPWKT
jgi:MFS family permease